MSRQNQILIVDDDRVTLKLLTMLLGKEGFLTVPLGDSEEAWRQLQSQPDAFSLVLLDRIMPKLDGLTFLQRLKADKALENIPVLLITSLDKPQDFVEGFQAGAHGYLAKPVNPDVLLAMIRSTIRLDYERFSLKHDLDYIRTALRLTDRLSCRIRTLEEADALAYMLGNAFVEPERLRCGLKELFVNAIEHGNLGISYEEKTRLMMENRWAEEVSARLQQEPYRNRFASVDIRQNPEGFRVMVADQGDGFDFERYLDFDPARMFHLHGKGIAMARTIYLDEVEYLGRGNQVRAFIRSDW